MSNPAAPLVAGQSQQQSQQKQMKSYTLSVIQGLRALGFDWTPLEKVGLQQPSATMFSKPNAKAFEHIVHFLLVQLDPDRAARVFSQCWPPLCKESIKEFKDAVFAWLSELATPTASITTASNQGAAKNQQNQTNLFALHHRLFQLIRVPPVSKSLLAVPCGIKACELLYCLTVYVVLVKVIRLSIANKTYVRINPKVSPLHSSSSSNDISSGKQPFNQSNINSLNWAAHTTRLTNQKILSKFAIQILASKRKIEDNEVVFNQILARQINAKLKYQSYMMNKLEGISKQIEIKAKKVEVGVQKQRFLCVELGLNEQQDLNESPETFYANYKESEQIEFGANLNKLTKFNANTFGSEMRKKPIDDLINGYDNRAELDGAELIQFLSNDNVLASIKECLDSSSSALFDFDIDEILKENRTKLDLINLARLRKLLISQKINLLNQINVDELRTTINYILNSSDDSTAAATTTLVSPIDQAINEDSFIKEKSINEQAEKLNKKLDSVIPKIREHLNELLRCSAKDVDDQTPRILEEDSELCKDLDKLNDRFYAVMQQRRSLDEKLLDEMRKKQDKQSLETNRIFENVDKQIETSPANSKIFSMEDLLSPTTPHREDNTHFNQTNQTNPEDCSLGILDLDGSEMTTYLL